VQLENLLAVSALAFVAPLVAVLSGRLRIPAVVLEIVLGIVAGPSVLGCVHVDTPVDVLSTLGLAVLLFLAGLEVDLGRLRGPLVRVVGSGMVLSLGIAAGAAYGLHAAGIGQAPLLVAVTLAATGLGLVVPVLKDSGEAEGDFGQLVIAAATVAEFTAIILLSLLFGRDASGIGARLALLVTFAAASIVIGIGLLRVGDTGRLGAVFVRLQDTTAQIRVRFAMVLCIGFAALAARLGLETILGAFVAGALLRAVDRDAMSAHPLTAIKLDAVGFGFLVPVFFVTSGLRFDLHALVGSGTAVALVPVFLAALIAARGLPALLYRSLLSTRRLLAAGLLQATSLSFFVAATQIGLELGLVTRATAAALIAAGLLSVLLLPPVALALLASGAQPASR
jgi:Kef-type K+ transport system membrane component KefB